MNKNNQLKTNRIILLFVILFVLIASIVIIVALNHKQDKTEKINDTETVPVPTPETEPETESGPETEPTSDSEQDSGSEEPERVFPAQVHYIAGWDRCLDQLCIDVDVVFMGDSITYKSSFEVEFPDLLICNLSVCSETIKGINYRVGTLQTVKPEKVFLMIGINSLKNNNLDVCVEDYRTLVDNIRSRGDFELYIMSVTPVAKNDSGEDNPSPETIVSFNEKIAELANEYGATYVDLHSKLKDDSGYIRPEYTEDGLHLSKEAYDVWTDSIKHYIE